MNKQATLSLYEVGCHENSLARSGFLLSLPELKFRGEFHNSNCIVV